MPVKYLSLDITCEFTSPAVLPVFKGSTLRGAFGHSLKRVSCALRKQECESCLLLGTCAYALIFATEKLHGERLAARPHPYILNSSVDTKQEYVAGDLFHFNLVLLGRATDFLPHIVYAIEEMGKGGLGQGNKIGFGRFCLTSIEMEGELIYSDVNKVLYRPDVIPELLLNTIPDNRVSSLAIDLLSPLRLKHANGLQRKISFHVLVRAALRRISALEKHYGGGDPDLDFSGLCRQAEAVVITEDDITWRDYRRYSNKQKKNMFIGGVVGKLVFEGDLEPFVPLFMYSRHVNLGKQTAFGLGRISVEITP